MNFVSKFESIFHGIHVVLLVASEGYLFFIPIFFRWRRSWHGRGFFHCLRWCYEGGTTRGHPATIEASNSIPNSWANSQALLEVLRPWVFVLGCWVLDMVSVTMLVVKSELESFFSIDLYLNSCHGLC